MVNIRKTYVDSSDGLHKLYTVIAEPSSSPRAVVHVFHGIIEHINRSYLDLINYLADNGFAVIAADQLGRGLSFQLPEDHGFIAKKDGWEHLINDMETLVQLGKTLYPGLPQIGLGFSFGSFMLRSHLIKYPGSFDAAIIMGTSSKNRLIVFGGKLLCEVEVALLGAHYRSKLLDSLAFGNFNHYFGTNRTYLDWISRDTERVDAMCADPLYSFLPTCSFFRDMMTGVDIMLRPANMAKMSKGTPILFISGGSDPVGNFGKGVQKAQKRFKRAGMEDVSVKLYPGARHALIDELNREEVFKDLVDWINAKLAAGFEL